MCGLIRCILRYEKSNADLPNPKISLSDVLVGGGVSGGMMNSCVVVVVEWLVVGESVVVGWAVLVICVVVGDRVVVCVLVWVVLGVSVVVGCWEVGTVADAYLNINNRAIIFCGIVSILIPLP